MGFLHARRPLEFLTKPAQRYANQPHTQYLWDNYEITTNEGLIMKEKKIISYFQDLIIDACKSFSSLYFESSQFQNYNIISVSRERITEFQ